MKASEYGDEVLAEPFPLRARHPAPQAAPAATLERDREVLLDRHVRGRPGHRVLEDPADVAGTLEVGPIRRSDVPVLVAGQEGLNVLGMSFLSSLQGWGVQGRTLVLQR